MSQILDLMIQYKLVTSLLLIALVILLREWVVHFIRERSKRKRKDRRGTITAIRNSTNFLLFIAIFLFWEGEIQSFALSIAAFTVAIILATREYVQCLLGFVYLSSTRPFSVGDWIQVDNYCGEVANKDWLKVSLLEVDHDAYVYTGKSLTIPNSLFVTKTVKNLNFLKRYTFHSFAITTEPLVDVFLFKDQLLASAKEYCSSFHDVAQRYRELIEKRLEVSIQSHDPEIRILTTDLGKIETQITIFCPTELALEIEQKLTQDFMRLWFSRQSLAAKEKLPASLDSAIEPSPQAG
jgi:small-conductance mechanosensitive channel